MGCLKLAYYESEPTLNVAYRNGIASEKSVQELISIDPLAEKFPYNGVYNFSENRVIDGIELEGLEVLLVGKYTTGSAGISGYAGGGVVIAPDGVYGFGEWGVGFETNVSISSEVGVTFYPTMPAAKYASGEGYSLGVNANVGLIANGTASVNAVESSGYYGVNTTFGVGAGLPGVVASVSGYKTNTTLKPISDLANKAVALDALNTAKTNLNGTYNSLASERNSLIKQQNHLREANRNIVSGLDSITDPDNRSAKIRELKANLDALNSSEASMNNLNENINNVKQQIDQINGAIDSLR